MSNESNNKRIAKNTFLLYSRMLLTVGVSFYTTRLILANLGVSDYGVYNVVGGFVSMFYMVTSTMTSAISRYLTFDLGTGKIDELRKTFSTSMYILLALSVVVLLLAETLGLWFVNTKLNFESNRMVAVNWVYQFSLLSFILQMVSVPYSSSVVSHERFGLFAVVQIVQVVVNLMIALFLSMCPIDKLIAYGFLMFCTSMLVQLIYYCYCRSKFEECKLTFSLDMEKLKSMSKFAGWNFLTPISSMLSTSGVNMAMNIYFGTTVNAARGVTGQINGLVGAFAKNFGMALNPQITKSYARNDIDYALQLVYRGARFSYLLLLLIGLPIMIETDFFLSVWLKEVPPYTVIFVRLQIFYALLDQLVQTSFTLNGATGHVRNNQILISTTQIFILIASLLTMILGGTPVAVAWVLNIAYIIIIIPRILINKPYVNISVRQFLRNVVYRTFAVTVVSATPCYLIAENFPSSWGRFLLNDLLCMTLVAVCSYSLGLTKIERNKITNTMLKRLKI